MAGLAADPAGADELPASPGSEGNPATSEQTERAAAAGESSSEVESSSEEGSGSEGEEEASSGDDDEKKPLAHRAAWAAKHALPKPTAPARTRVNRFPKIPKSERCGKCENCLNPQRKKACIVARQRMEQRLREQEQQQQRGALARQGSGGASQAPHSSMPAPADVANDPFARTLKIILSADGSVTRPDHVPQLLDLIKRAKTMHHRTLLLQIVRMSAPEVLRKAVEGQVLVELQRWLDEYVADGKQKMVKSTLDCLDKLPVTLASLQQPCTIGRSVGKLRKSPGFDSAVHDTANRLVARWKAVVEGSSTTGSGAAPKPALGAKPGTAVKPAPTAVAKPGVAAGKAATAKPVAAASGAGVDRQASGNLAVIEDGDLFKNADRQRAGIKDAVPSVKKVVTIKTISVETTRGKPSVDASQPASAPAAAASGKEPAGTAKPGSSGPVAGQTDISKVSASPFASLGGLSSGVTVLGGSSSSLSMTLSGVGSGLTTARERAAAAARQVPSPEPQPRKEKKKKVSWVGEEEMVGVRWFRKDDPPAAAQRDVDLSQALVSTGSDATSAAAAAAREPSPPGFESAAKKEHLSEAEALRRHRAEEDQERLEMSKRLACMVPTTAWMNPLPTDEAAMPAPPARGEDSTEARAAAARREQVPPALYANHAAVPDCPAEPSNLPDHGTVQHPATIPRIPLSLEEAAAMQQQNHQQQQQQQVPPMQPAAQQRQQLPQPMQSAVQQQQQLPPAMMQGTQQQGGQPPPMYRQQVLPQQQTAQQQASQPPPMALPDISTALAQLAASGVLNAVSKGTTSSMPMPQQPMQQQLMQQQPMQQRAQHQQQPMQPMYPPTHGRPPPQQQQLPGAYPHAQQQGPPGHAWTQGHRPQGPERQQQHPHPPAPTQRPGYGPRECRYFNTPKGCWMGDRCNFAHVPASVENGRSGAGGAKRPAEGDGRGDRQVKGRWGR